MRRFIVQLRFLRSAVLIWCYFPLLMHNLSTLVTLVALVAFTAAPGLADRDAHCLGHAAENTFSAPQDGAGQHGVHHADCYWLGVAANGRAVQTTRSVSTPLPALAAVAPLIFAHCIHQDVPSLSLGRAPPALRS